MEHVRGKMKLATIDLSLRIGTGVKAEFETVLNWAAAAQSRDLLERRGAIVAREFKPDDRQRAPGPTRGYRGSLFVFGIGGSWLHKRPED